MACSSTRPTATCFLSKFLSSTVKVQLLTSPLYRFLSPRVNKRTDQYGGSLEVSRVRLPQTCSPPLTSCPRTARASCSRSSTLSARMFRTLHVSVTVLCRLRIC